MSTSGSRSSGAVVESSTRARFFRTVLSISARIDSFLVVVDLGEVGVEDLPAPGLELVGEQAAVGAEAAGHHHPPDLLVPAERSVRGGELRRYRPLVGGLLGRR